MFGFNFTERTRRVLEWAREASERLRHEYVGTEHILLGLVRDEYGVAAQVVHNLGLDRAAIVRRVEEVIKPGRRPPETRRADLPYTTRAKKVLELAMMEARDLTHSYVGTEHLLLGLLREGMGIGGQVLVEAGVTLEAARAETLRILGTELSPNQVKVGEPTAFDVAEVARVEITLRMRDGRHVQGAFDSPRDAIAFLETLA